MGLLSAIIKIINRKKYAHDEIWTRAGSPPADLESAALDRSATCAKDNHLPKLSTFDHLKALRFFFI